MNPTAMRILTAFGSLWVRNACGDVTVSEVMRETGLGYQAVSAHLTWLQRRGLIVRDRGILRPGVCV